VAAALVAGDTTGGSLFRQDKPVNGKIVAASNGTKIRFIITRGKDSRLRRG
jgi:hypothetical protein